MKQDLKFKEVSSVISKQYDMSYWFQRNMSEYGFASALSSLDAVRKWSM